MAYINKSLAATLALASSVAFSQVQVDTLVKDGKNSLTQTELVELITGNTLKHRKLNSSLQLDMHYRSDNIRVYWTGGPNIGKRFEGWYKIKDGKRCELSGGGGEVCFTLYPSASNKYFLCDSNNRCDWEVTVEKGNPDSIE
jgi:hypothetical protein